MKYIVFGKPDILSEDISSVVHTLETGWIGTGPRVKEFEEKIRAFLGCKNAVAVSSCTAGLFLSLLCNGIGKGDEVIVPSMTFCATANVVEHLGAKPVFIDVKDTTYCMPPENFRKYITKKTKAVIPVHFGGNPCQMDEINEIAEAYDIKVIQDSAHALGTKYKGMRVGAKGTCCFSFYPTKPITTIEGGIVATDDDKLAEKVRIYSNHGLSADAWKRYGKESPGKYQVVYPGYKFNMTDVSASLGLSQLQRVLRDKAIRKVQAMVYRENITNCDLTLPSFQHLDDSSWHLFPILVKNRDKFRELMHKKGIGTGIHYEAVHLQPYYQKYKCKLPRTEYFSKRTVSLPIQASLEPEEMVYVHETVNNILEAF